MVFSSITFLCLFLPVVLLLHTVIRNIHVRNALLLAASLLFYAWGEPVWILAMLFTVAVNYAAALLIAGAATSARRKVYLAVGLAVSFAFLFYFKYSLFTVNTARALLGRPLLENGPALPIGISFYTFQVVTYTVDVYRGKSAVQKNPLLLLLYVSFFPQLIAGPIVQYGQISAMLTDRTVTRKGFYTGFLRFVRGLGKKVLLANLFAGAIAVLPSASGAEPLSVCGAWLVAVLFSMQLFFDFSGYSDMAIGIGRMCGFTFLENFNCPYIAGSVTEFWRRWHISLGSFFREYVYIPLGGNRVGRGRFVCNLLLVWALTGLWHGASWNFVVWGVYYGVLLLLEKLVLARVLPRIPAAVRHAGTLLLVVAGWVLFYYVDLGEGAAHLGAMIGIGASGGWIDAPSWYVLKRYGVPMLIGAVCCLPLDAYIRAWAGRARNGGGKPLRIATLTAAVVALALSVCSLLGQSFNPFLYFRF